MKQFTYYSNQTLPPPVPTVDDTTPTTGVAFNKTSRVQFFTLPIPALLQGAVSVWLRPSYPLVNFLLDMRQGGEGYVWHGGLSNATLYVNGVAGQMSSVPANVWSRAVIHLGNQPAGTTLTFFARHTQNEPLPNVDVANVRVYNQLFTAAQLADNISYPASDALLAYYPLQEVPQGTTLNDMSGRGNNAQLYGFTTE